MTQARRAIAASLLALVSAAGPVRAHSPQRPEADGPLATRTVEFADLSDAARAGRRLPIKVHLPRVDRTIPGGRAVARRRWQLGRQPCAGTSPGESWIRGAGARASGQQHRGDAQRHALRRQPEGDDTRCREVLGRPADVRFALDQAEHWNRDRTPSSRGIRPDARGRDGPLFGAYTALAVCGARPALDWLEPPVEPGRGLGPDLSDARVKACVALSPQGPGEPFFLEDSFATIDRPVLAISGSRDEQQGTTPANRRRFFELEPVGAKVFVWLANADHLAFSDATGSRRTNLPSRSRADVQPIARAATLLFFEAQSARRRRRRCAVVRARAAAAGARRGQPASRCCASNACADAARRMGTRSARLPGRSPSPRASMTAVTESALLEALKAVVDPNTGKDFVSTKQLKNLRIDGADVAFDVELGYPAASQIAALRARAGGGGAARQRGGQRQRQLCTRRSLRMPCSAACRCCPA